MIENVAVNRAERMRWRALNIEARAGRYERYWNMLQLSLEGVQDTSDWEPVLEAPRAGLHTRCL